MLRSKTILPLILGVALLGLPSSVVVASEVVYDAGNRRDPFVPLTGGENTPGDATASVGVKLEGIIYDPGERSMAILNGKSYQAGEIVGDATVVNILKDHVVISVGGEEKTLWIREEEKT